jgi:hypothetical protein
VVGLVKNTGIWPQRTPWPLMVTRFVSKVGFGPLPGVLAQLGKAVEIHQPDVEQGGS